MTNQLSPENQEYMDKIVEDIRQICERFIYPENTSEAVAQSYQSWLTQAYPDVQWTVKPNGAILDIQAIFIPDMITIEVSKKND